MTQGAFRSAGRFDRPANVVHSTRDGGVVAVYEDYGDAVRWIREQEKPTDYAILLKMYHPAGPGMSAAQHAEDHLARYAPTTSSGITERMVRDAPQILSLRAEVAALQLQVALLQEERSDDTHEAIALVQQLRDERAGYERLKDEQAVNEAEIERLKAKAIEREQWINAQGAEMSKLYDKFGMVEQERDVARAALDEIETQIRFSTGNADSTHERILKVIANAKGGSNEH
jgi:hypothetical protein